MPLSTIKLLTKTTGFRLALWYSIIFISSSLLLFALLYFPLRTAILEKDRNAILSKLNEYVLQEQQRGLTAMLAEIRLEDGHNRQAGFFVRVADPTDQSLIVTLPPEWRQLGDGLSPMLHTDGGSDGWTIHPAEGRDDAMEIISRRLGNGYLLQIGRGSGERQKILKYFGEIFAGIMLPMVIIGFAGGFFLAYRFLRPVRDLIFVVRNLDIGKMDTRVPSRQTGDELDELVNLFNTMLEKIEILLTGMRAALDNVAHDLRTPVTRLRAGIETALQSESGNSAAVLREALLDCAEESERIITMLNTLMDISEAETGVMRLYRQPVSIVALLTEVADLYQYVAEEKGVAVSVSGPSDLTVMVDIDRMRQVVGNLLDNSLKHTAPGGRVDLSCNRDEGNVLIRVQDTGVGISNEDLPRIFDRLYRGDQSRSQRGLGLGLSLVEAVIHAHAGTIEVKSAPEEGATFTLLLPAESIPLS